jgi:hypothetical protein
MADDLDDKVRHPDLDLAICDYKKCKEYGEHIRCYFVYQNCDRFLRWAEARRIIENYRKRKV